MKTNSHSALVRCSEIGWINTPLFAEFGEHFMDFLTQKNMEDIPHLVLLDGHTTHTYNVEFLNLMKHYGITVIQIPAHTSHFVQPMDSAPLANLKERWSDELHYWNRKKGGVAITKEEWFLPFNRAWRNGLTPRSIQAGFKKTGIWPLNFDMIPDNAFKESDLLCPPRRVPRGKGESSSDDDSDKENAPSPPLLPPLQPSSDESSDDSSDDSS